jgi:TolB-like protein/Flp pilus assembly protein TadD
LGLVAVLALYHGFQSTFVTTAEPGVEGDATTHTHPMLPFYSRKSIAVLPFVDLSDGQTYQYLGDGIAEEIINLLADMDGLGVAARTSSFAFRDSSSTTGEIAAKLRVGIILEGSIRHSGKRIRVTAQLIDTQTGYHIWSKNYDRTLDEVFEVQDDIAFNIAQSLKLTLDESDAPDSRSATTGDIEAFALYLKGRELFNDRIHLRAEGLREALDYFSKAVKQDPTFARAHAGIASVYWLLTSYDDSLDKDAYFELAEASANFALEFDPVSTDALAALASIHSARGDIEQAGALFEQIRIIGSNDTNIDFWEAMLHIRLGYFDELIEPLTEVYRLDPFNEHIGWSLAAALNFSGKPAEAARILEELEHFTYRQYVLGLTAINQKNYLQARELLRDARMRSGVLPAVYADLLVDALETPGLKEAAARKFISAAETGELTELVSFEALLILGSPHAFDLGIDPLSDITRIQIHAQLWNNWAVALRQDPGFKDWVTKLGYADFWRRHGWPDRCRPTGPDDFECI